MHHLHVPVDLPNPFELNREPTRFSSGNDPVERQPPLSVLILEDPAGVVAVVGEASDSQM
jgi:hypothetical protein